MFFLFVDKENIVLTRQYRYLVDRITCKISTGKINKDEMSFGSVAREFEEETGYRAK
ncbi:MAG: NUDIX domain-containing protein [Endomicrobium sp.]|nr:NUDIX domain-containing protein [Endomicrobium sp.]